MHRALGEKNELAAVFLISNGANIHDAPKICDTEVEILDDGEEYETGGYEDSAPKTVEEILAEAASESKKSKVGFHGPFLPIDHIKIKKRTGRFVDL